MEQFLKQLDVHPVIAAARDHASVQRAARSPVAAVFLLGGSILTLEEMADTARDAGKRVFVHLDLCEGLNKDDAAVEWCARFVRPDGLISTRTPLLKKASRMGLITIQRLFIMDSSAISHGIKLLRASPPDMVEVLPGLLPKAIGMLCEAIARPVIAGGMITEKDEVLTALQAGARGVSSSHMELWK